MDGLNLKLSAKDINAKTFQSKEGGYDSLQVDQYLDLIVNDYIAFEQFRNAAEKQKTEADALQKTCEFYQTKLSESEKRAAAAEEQLKALRQTEGINLSNLELLQRISALEQALYNLGKDPSKIK